MRLPSKQSESAALVAKYSAKKKETLKIEKKCFHCHNSGHTAKYCYKKSDTSKQHGGDAFICNTGVPETALWLADSDASAHMTSSRKCFLSMTEGSLPK